MRKTLSRLTIAAGFIVTVCTAAPGQLGRAVLTEHGFPLKGITRRDGQLFTKPDLESGGRTVGQFKFVYILPPDPETLARKIDMVGSLTENGFYRVSASDSDSTETLMGWLPEENVELWQHIQALGFSRSSARPPVPFFESMEELQRSFESELGPAYREPLRKGDNLILMPLLEALEWERKGSKQELFMLSFMAGPAATSDDSAPGVGPEPGKGEERAANASSFETDADADDGQELSASLDLVFVIDTTGSMGEPIAQVLKSIEAVSKELERQEGIAQLRLGLVGYRDQRDRDYVSDIFCTLEQGTDIDFFITQLRGLEAEGGGDWPEDVWAGVNTAMDRDEMKWSPSPLSWPIITIVGDAPAHPADDPKNSTKHTPTSILRTAQPEQTQGHNPIVFVAQQIMQGNAADQQRMKSQLLELTEEATHAGAYVSSRGSEDFSAELTATILNRMKILDKVVTDPVAAVARFDEERTTPGTAPSAAEYPSFVIERLRTGGPDASATEFSKAFASEFNPDGQTQLIPYVFVQKGRLRQFRSWLDLILGKLDSTGRKTRSAARAIDEFKSISATMQLGGNVEADMPLMELASAVAGFPVRSSLFDRTIQDLVVAPQDVWEEWRNGIREVTKILQVQLDNPAIWHPLADGVSTDHYHAFIKLSDLP